LSKTVAIRWFREAGGVMPDAVPPGVRSMRRLSFTEREEIGCRHAAGEGVRAIARVLARSPSMVSRELVRGTVRRKTGYRPSVAQAGADARSRRPKAALLARNERLRDHVQGQLRAKYSPEQVSRRLAVDFQDDPEMRVSHETIYQALYVQGRGALRRELAACLRTGRALRRPRRKTAKRRGRIAGMVNISQRPAEAEDRAVPGHWEGDLITGSVERATGYVMLLHLPVAHGALEVQDAMVEVMSLLPDTLRRTLTWDQGREMCNHAQIAEATELDIYFCDPHSPWQRGTRENTNGLLRQYFRRAPTCPATTATTSSSSPPNSTAVPASDSAGAVPPRPSTRYSPIHKTRPALG
jgi:IS30 family transposase